MWPSGLNLDNTYLEGVTQLQGAVRYKSFVNTSESFLPSPGDIVWLATF